MERSQQASSTSNLMDTHQRLIAAILTHYRTLMMLATIQAEGERTNANPEAVAVVGLSMKTEFEGLYSSIKDLLALSRKIKELWVFGPLTRHDPDQKAKEEQIERDVADVATILNEMQEKTMKDLAEKNGGRWKLLEEGIESMEGVTVAMTEGKNENSFFSVDK